MITVSFMGQSISVHETPLTKYAQENSISLQSAINALFGNLTSNYEKLEQELASALGRLPSQAEMNYCSSSIKDYYQYTVLPNAIKYGSNLMNEFMADNILAGITQAGKTKIIGEACKDIAYWLSMGNLYEAVNAIDTFTYDIAYEPYITEEKLTAFRAKILLFFA